MAVNLQVFQGKLGQDAKVSEVGGRTRVSFSLANNRRYTTKGGEKREETTWMNVVAWGGVASGIVNYLTKGREVVVEGRIEHYDAVDQKDGATKRYYVLNANSVHFAGGRNDGDAAPKAQAATGYGSFDDDEDTNGGWGAGGDDDGAAPWS